MVCGRLDSGDHLFSAAFCGARPWRLRGPSDALRCYSVYVSMLSRATFSPPSARPDSLTTRRPASRPPPQGSGLGESDPNQGRPPHHEEVAVGPHNRRRRRPGQAVRPCNQMHCLSLPFQCNQSHCLSLPFAVFPRRRLVFLPSVRWRNAVLAIAGLRASRRFSRAGRLSPTSPWRSCPSRTGRAKVRKALLLLLRVCRLGWLRQCLSLRSPAAGAVAGQAAPGRDGVFSLTKSKSTEVLPRSMELVRPHGKALSLSKQRLSTLKHCLCLLPRPKTAGARASLRTTRVCCI